MAVNKTIEILDRHKGLAEFIAPTGIKYSVVQIAPENTFFRIKSSQGNVPDKLEGSYTSILRAEVALKNFLVALWDKSDAIAEGTRSNKVA